MKVKYLITLTTGLLLWSCSNNSDKENQEESAVTTNVASFKNVDTAVASQLNQVIQHYIHLKNGLIQSNATEAKAGADGILKAIAAVDISKMTAEQSSSYNSAIVKLKESTKTVYENTDLEKQREAFNGVTESVYSLLKNFGGSKPFYYQFCPMANNNNGGYWVSESEEVKNPYFGDEMLNCGEVKETLK